MTEKQPENETCLERTSPLELMLERVIAEREVYRAELARADDGLAIRDGRIRSECATIVRRYLTTRADGDNGYLIADGDDDAMLAEIEGRLPEEGKDHDSVVFLTTAT